MSIFASSRDLLRAALRFAGESENSNSPLYTKALDYLNHAYRSVLGGPSEFEIDFNSPFSWAREISPLKLVLKPRFREGTVSLTNTVATATLSDPPAFSLVDYHLKVSGRPELYRVIAHTASDPTVTLEGGFVGDTAVFDCEFIKIIYDLGADVLRLSEAFRVYRHNDSDNSDIIEHLPLNYFRQEFPLRRVQQRVPNNFTVLSEDTTSFKIMFNSFVEKDTLVEIDWVKYPDELTDSDAEQPIIPLKDRVVLSYLAASQILLNDKKETDRAQIQLGLAKSMLRAMIERENKRNTVANRNYGRIIPRRGQLNRTRKTYYH